MSHVFGWWHLDSDGPALINSVTGERVLFDGIQQPLRIARETTRMEAVGKHYNWLRFNYEHHDLRYPVLVKTTEDIAQGHPVKSWQVDHIRSAMLWRQGANVDATFPPYGVWRRVDECVSDAFVCWPEVEATGGPRKSGFELDGGWLNGGWSEKLYREVSGLGHSERKAEAHGILEMESGLVPLDAPPPPPWVFHGFPESGCGENSLPDKTSHPEIVVPVSLEGLIRRPELLEDGQSLALPTRWNLTGFEGRTAYLCREDGLRVLFPSSGDRRQSSGHVQPSFTFVYADEDSVCEFRGRPNDVSTQSWSFDLALSGFGRRGKQADPTLKLRCVDRRCVQAGGFRPSHALWRRIAESLTDAWLSWGGTEARSPEWHESLMLVPADEILIGSGYRGGIYLNTVTTRVRARRRHHTKREKALKEGFSALLKTHNEFLREVLGKPSNRDG